MRCPPTIRQPARRHAAGFSTIELMTAIAIIALLIAIITIGYRYVAQGTERGQTKTLLERMRSVAVGVQGNKAAAQRFYQQQIPAIYRKFNGGTTPWTAVPANSQDALFRTGMITRALLANAESKAIFDDIPSERRRDLYFYVTTGLPATGPGTNIEKLPFLLDAWGKEILFVFDNWQEATGTTSSRVRLAPSGAPTGGLTDVYSESAKLCWEVDGVDGHTPDITPYTFSHPSGFQNAPENAIRAPDRMPFWFSAGPDGLYQTHDDNVYSFEN